MRDSAFPPDVPLMTSQPRASKMRRLWLILPLSPCRARTSAWWLLVILPCIRRWSAANQRKIRFWSWERRAVVLLLPLATREVCKTGGRHVERPQILLLNHRKRAGELPVVAKL
jgi:hypothetical protein